MLFVTLICQMSLAISLFVAGFAKNRHNDGRTEVLFIETGLQIDRSSFTSSIFLTLYGATGVH